MKKKLLLIPLSVILIFLFVNSVYGFAAQQKLRYALGTSTVGGVYYIYGTGLAKVLNEHIDYLSVNNEVTGGPNVNIGLIQNGDTMLGQATVGPAYEAWHGVGWANGKKYDRIRSLVPMYPSALQITVLEESGIKTIYDLEDKVVAIGGAGGSADSVGRNILKTLGIKPKNLQNMSSADQIGNLKDGLVDVVMEVGGWPFPARQELEATHKVGWVTFTSEDLDKILEAYPYYSKDILPKGTYKSMVEDYPTIFLWNEVIISKDVPEDVAYDITKAIFDYQDELIEAHTMAEHTIPENIVNIPVPPLHPGAIRYYREMNIELSEEQTLFE